MKVKELIERLRKFENQDLEVLVAPAVYLRHHETGADDEEINYRPFPSLDQRFPIQLVSEMMDMRDDSNGRFAVLMFDTESAFWEDATSEIIE